MRRAARTAAGAAFHDRQRPTPRTCTRPRPGSHRAPRFRTQGATPTTQAVIPTWRLGTPKLGENLNPAQLDPAYTESGSNSADPSPDRARLLRGQLLELSS